MYNGLQKGTFHFQIAAKFSCRDAKIHKQHYQGVLARPIQRGSELKNPFILAQRPDCDHTGLIHKHRGFRRVGLVLQ